MKQGLLLLITSLTISLNSCKKAEPISSANKEEQERNYIAFMEKQNQQYSSENVSRLDDWAKHVLREDLNGAAIGAGLCWQGPHVIGCAAFGAGLFSLLAFYTEYGYDECGNWVCIKCNDPTYTYTPNPFNNVGIYHNQLIANALNNVSSIAQNCNVVDSLAGNFMLNDICQTLNITLDSFEFKNKVNYVVKSYHDLHNIDQNASSYDNACSSMASYLAQKGVLSSFSKKAYISYLITLGKMKSYSDIYNYTKNLESELISTTAIAESDKTVLLSIYATARYSAGLWMNEDFN